MNLISPSVSDRTVTEFTKADLFFSQETAAHFLQSLPQALTTRKLASNVVTNLDPAGDSSTMEVTMSPMVALRIEARLSRTSGSICWPFNPYSGPSPGPQAYAYDQVLYTALCTFLSLSWSLNLSHIYQSIQEKAISFMLLFWKCFEHF